MCIYNMVPYSLHRADSCFFRRASWCRKQAFFASKPLIELKAPAAVASSREKKPQVTPSRSLDGGSESPGHPQKS